MCDGSCEPWNMPSTLRWLELPRPGSRKTRSTSAGNLDELPAMHPGAFTRVYIEHSVFLERVGILAGDNPTRGVSREHAEGLGDWFLRADRVRSVPVLQQPGISNPRNRR